MDLLSHVLEVDFFVIVTMIFLRHFLRANDAFDHDLNVHIYQTIWMLLALAFFETMDAILADLAQCSALLRGLFIGAAYILEPFLLMFTGMAFRQYQLSKKERWQLVIPSLVNMVIILTAFFNPYVFSIDESNTLHRLVFGFAPFLADAYYLVFILRTEMQQRRRGFEDEARIILTALIGLLAGLVAENIYGIRGAECGVVGLTITFYYLYRHMDSSRRDTLTGAFNRASFFADLAKMHPDQITAFCEFDMNNLKEINDKLGHNEGDKAIVAMYSIIQNCLPTQSHLYRFGGDEFAVLFFDVNMSTVYGTVFRIREEFEKSKYGCAIGIAEWKEGATFREVYNLADEQMYADKKHQKEKAAHHKAAGEKAEPEESRSRECDD